MMQNQQAMCQPEQMAQQQVQNQQMMLCPVRVVYETQILVPPGDQIQPNQTIFINPQNPPPWLQNRPIQNQIIYVQQMPNNIAPQVQQHIDQNQLYLQQNFANYQQVMHPMFIQHQEQIRPNHLPITNMMSPNMIQAPNIGSNVQMVQNERPITQTLANYEAIPTTNGSNKISETQNQVLNKQTVTMQVAPRMHQVTANTQKIQEMRNHVFQNSMQLTQENSIIRQQMPQVLAMSQEQNHQNLYQSIPNQNIRLTRPTYIQNINNSAALGISNQQTTNHQMRPKANNVVPITNYNKPNALNTPRQNQSYRPIQPRPQLNANILTNSTMSTPIQIQSAQQMQHIPNNPIAINRPLFIPNTNNNHQNYPNLSSANVSYIKTTVSTVNRKRKSESPDEIHKKIIVNSTNNLNSNSQVNDKIIVQPQVHPVKKHVITLNEIGVNTSPVHKTEDKASSIQFHANLPQIAKIVQPNNYPRTNTSQLELPTEKALKPNEDNIKVRDASQQTEKDKLRNTVYTQARGRLINEKTETQAIVTADVKTVNNPGNSEITVSKIPPEAPINKKELGSDNLDMTPLKIDEKIITPHESLIVKEKEDITEQSKDSEIKNEHVVDTVKEEKDYILTHVLDGYVIQESNTAFPIRKPLKEKSLYPNTQELDYKTQKLESYNDNERKDLTKDKSKPDTRVELKDTKMEEVSENTTEKGCNEDNPFMNLKPLLVKSWTVDELCRHLSKYNWTETISLLQDHEIDGESLFLVSKTQLINIGIKENYADIICEFVKS